ncbi:hypothetical protein LCGC14_1225590, partial [marine sediment metagenome]
MPESALPPHLRNFNWKGTDNASWLMRQKKKIQVYLAAGPRVPSGFFKWREYPVTLFALKSSSRNRPHLYRTESTDGNYHSWVSGDVLLPNWGSQATDHYVVERVYLSRIQPWCRWHISLQWPLFFNCHFIYRQKNVVVYPTYQSAFGITKMFTFGFGFKRDGDKIYW